MFPGIGVPAGTGAPGGTGVSASDTSGPVVGTPVVSNPYGSSQVPANMPRVAVHSGDTSGMADDSAAGVSAIAPGPQDGYLATGAGQGGSHDVHPNAGR
jgi:hypothetical protein